MKNIKILFMGTPDIAVSMLDHLVKDGYEVIGVVTQPDKKAGRKQQIKMSEVKIYALEHELPVYQPISIRNEYQELASLSMDLIVTCAYGQFVPKELLDAPTYGSINVHASLLPKWRGGAPIHKAVIEGDKECGMSIMRMVKKMDAGAVMSQCSVPILQEDTTGDMYIKLAKAGADLLSESIPKIIDGTAVFIEQDEDKATFAYTIQKEEEHIDFKKDVQSVYNHIRGLIPFPVGNGVVNGKKIKFHKVRMIKENHNHQLGEMIGWLHDGYAIAAKDGYIIVDEIQLEGKAKIDAKSFYNGNGKQFIGKIVE